jgi:transposase
MANRKSKTSVPRKSKTPTPQPRPIRRSPPPSPTLDPAEALRQVGRIVARERRHAEECARLAALPVLNTHAAGIDAGDATHWVSVGVTPDGSNPVREFPAHTAGLRELVAWLQHCGITTVAIEATGAYGHVLFLTLLEAKFEVTLTPPQFARQIKGRPKTDRRDCQWIQHLHALGMLPKVFQPDEATQTLRHYVRHRSNMVRLSSQHIQRMQKALALMNLKLTSVIGDITGVTGLKIIRAILAGRRDPDKLAKLRDRRCQHTEPEIAQALDGRYRPEHLLELRDCLTMWEHYQAVIAGIDEAIAAQLHAMRQHTKLPPLPPKPRKRGRKPHDPCFDVRTALYYVTGIDLLAIEGIDELHALTLVSELGFDFSKWPTSKHFTCWLGLCPNWKKTGGKVQSSRTRKGKNRAARALCLAAWCLIKSKSYLGSYIRRQRSRLGATKAITATAHKLARIIYNMMRYGIAFAKQAEEAYAQQVHQRLEKQLRRRAREMGYELKAIEPPAVPTVQT